MQNLGTRHKLIAGLSLFFLQLPFFIRLAFGLGPPWPSEAKVSALSVFAAFIGIALAYRSRALRQQPLRLVAGLLVLSSLYLVLTSLFCVNASDSRKQVARGFLPTEDTITFLESGELLSDQELIEATGVENGAEKLVWVGWTVDLVRLSILGTWLGVLGFFGALATVYVTGRAMPTDSRDEYKPRTEVAGVKRKSESSNCPPCQIQADSMNSKFDVFLSHNSADKAIVRKLARVLTERGLHVWLDEDELRPGTTWQDELENIIASCKSAAVCFGESWMGKWEDLEMRALLMRFAARKRVGEALPVIPVLLPRAPDDIKLPAFLQLLTWVDLRDGMRQEGIDRLQWGITGTKPDAD